MRNIFSHDKYDLIFKNCLHNLYLCICQVGTDYFGNVFINYSDRLLRNRSPVYAFLYVYKYVYVTLIPQFNAIL